VSLILILGIFSAGCASNGSRSPADNDIVFIVTGVGGNSGYEGIRDAVSKPGRAVQIIPWGSPVFVMNFSTEWIHNDAEKMLAQKIDAWHKDHPTGVIDLVGHSAGCGVVLGALPRTNSARANTVILLAPSVSPSYDLAPAMVKIDGKLHVFYSDRDTFFLDWRTSNFGTYDRVRSKAAGNVGFPDGKYPAAKVVQHPYDPAWESLGNDGGHYGVQGAGFAKQILAPLLELTR
jgi:pimeloyl-ACP methyl ester carboxylesterase